MSYTVLARKWRPKNFSELVGQSHVMQALSNALDQQRLHHAYLFTGTRGVGKTTIARIFAKALNCQQGISSKPCSDCETCRAIDEGRFIDLIEVDAASRTKVDDTREILDNVQFAPTQGRYKVYLIDEVHMLSKSSFNALLKTLEEPPEHVKFLLATTDPHKLPITVLSRCLQFNLMRLTQPQIQSHLAYILQQENIEFEESALGLIAKSADGSARDSLSLLDQAIAYGAGQVMFDAVQTMLGLVDQQYGVAILKALAADSGEDLKQIIQQLAVMGVDYQALLSQLIESLHAISYRQVFADQEANSLLPAEVVSEMASLLSPERVQMLYQVALLAKQDMQLAPDMRIAFEMTLIRMLAFQPLEASDSLVSDGSVQVSSQTASEPAAVEPSMSEMSPADAMASLASARSLVGKKNTEISPSTAAVEIQTPQNSFNEQFSTPNDIQQAAEYSVADISSQQGIEGALVGQPSEQISEPKTHKPTDEVDHLSLIRAKLKQPFNSTQSNDSPKVSNNSETLAVEKPNPVFEQQDSIEPDSVADDFSTSSEHEEKLVKPDNSSKPFSLDANIAETHNQEVFEPSGDLLKDWQAIIEVLNINGMAAEIARNSVLVELNSTALTISIDPEQEFAMPEKALQQISDAVKQRFGSQVDLQIASVDQHYTPAKMASDQQQNLQQSAVDSIHQDPVVQQLQNTLGMELIPGTIKPIN